MAKSEIKNTIVEVKISDVKPNPNNPRIIKDDKFKKLVQSIKDFPKMLELRPIVVNDDMIVLGGNMRLKACKEAGLKEVPIIKASELSEDQQREFIIKDNVGFGEWDWDMIANEWDTEQIEAWGLMCGLMWGLMCGIMCRLMWGLICGLMCRLMCGIMCGIMCRLMCRIIS